MEPGTQDAERPQARLRPWWWAIVAAGVAIFMTTVDNTIVNAALPSMERSFDVSPQGGVWLILAYAGTMIAFQLPAGRWLDQLGSRFAFSLGVIGFAVASVLCALSPSLDFLVGARVLQGAFGALLGSQIPGLIIHHAPPDRRGRAMGITGTLGPLGAISGPPLGSLLLSFFSWQSIFLVNVPVGLVALYLGLQSIRGDFRFSLPGAALAREGAVALVWSGALFAALTLAAQSRPRYAAVLLLLLLFLVSGAVWYRMPGGQVLGGLVRQRYLGLILLGQFGLNLVGGAMFYLPPFTLDKVLHTPIAQWGPVLLCMSLGLALISNVSGAITDRWGTNRTALLGAALVVLSTGSLLVDLSAGGAVGLAVRLLLIGVGMGFYYVPMQTVFMTEAPANVRGTAGAATSMIRQIGFSVGPALGTLVWLTAGDGTASGLSDAYVVPFVSALVSLVMALTITVWRSRSRAAVASSTS